MDAIISEAFLRWVAASPWRGDMLRQHGAKFAAHTVPACSKPDWSATLRCLDSHVTFDDALLVVNAGGRDYSMQENGSFSEFRPGTLLYTLGDDKLKLVCALAAQAAGYYLVETVWSSPLGLLNSKAVRDGVVLPEFALPPSISLSKVTVKGRFSRTESFPLVQVECPASPLGDNNLLGFLEESGMFNPY